MNKELSILVGLHKAADVEVISRLLQQHSFFFMVCRDPETLLAETAEGRGVLLLDEEILTVPTFEKLQAILDDQPLWSELPIVLLVRRQRDLLIQGKSMLKLVPNLTIIERPVSSVSLVSVLQTALESRQRQYQLRELLTELYASNRELEKRLRQAAVTENTDVMLAYLDRYFNITWVNQAYADTCRMQAAEIIGRNYFDLFPDEENEAIFRRVHDGAKSVFFKDKPFVFQEQPDRGLVYLDWSLVPVKDRDGAVDGMVFSLRETTEYVRMQQALAESEERFRSIAHTSMDIIFQVDNSGSIIFVSPSVQAMGYSPGEVAGRSFEDFIIPDDIPRVRKAFRQIITRGTIKLLDLRLVRSDSTVVDCEINANPILRLGEIAGVQGIVRDITVRRRAEDAIRHKEAQLQATLNNLTEGVIVSEPDGRLIYWNPVAMELHGFTSEEEYLRPLSDFQETFELSTPEDGILPLEKWPMNRILQGENLHNWEVRVRRCDIDRERIYNYSGTLARDADNSPLLGILTMTDISARKMMESNLRRSNEDLQNFASIVSHDLKAPLRTISSFVQLLARKYSDRLDDKGQSFMHHIVDGTSHMQRLLDDLLKYSRVGGELEREFVSLDKILDDVRDKLARDIKRHRAEITTNGMPVVCGDSMQLFTLLQNLIGNALKYRSKETPRIEITSERHQNEWIIGVRDNGIGIDPRHAEQIFLIFKRLHLQQEYEGTGIGLAICKRIVERHGGRIWVESALGEGATFYLTLPVPAGKTQ